jgi:hypothetical protein
MPEQTPDLSILTGGQPPPVGGALAGDLPKDLPKELPCGDFGIRIARDGTWFHNGLPFTRLPLVKLFSTIIRRAPNGDYLLQTPVEKGRIEVEDAPYVAVEMLVEGCGRDQLLKFRTNIDQWVEAGPHHPIWFVMDGDEGDEEAQPSPYIIVKPGIEAMINRAVFYDLVELADDLGDYFGVWSGGVFHPLGKAQA